VFDPYDECGVCGKWHYSHDADPRRPTDHPFVLKEDLMKKTTKKKKELAALIPPDLKRCQAEKPNGHSFMTLGGVPGRERCTDKPTVVVTEVAPGADGRRGSMSLCHHCWAVALEQLGAYSITAEPILETK
jgi:hypothetical protein